LSGRFKGYSGYISNLHKLCDESLLPFPAWGAGNVSPYFTISPHIYPVILNSFPNKYHYHFHYKKLYEVTRRTFPYMPSQAA
jgi:hypothetical protein